MSVRQMAIVWGLDLQPNKRLVLLAYADHAHDDGSHVFPSLGRIAYKTGYSKDQARRISRQLVDEGLMQLVREATATHPAEYRLTLENGEDLPPFKPKNNPDKPGGLQSATPPQSATPRVADDPSPPGASVPPEPPVQPSENHSLKGPGEPGITQNGHINHIQVLVDGLQVLGHQLGQDDKRKYGGQVQQLRSKGYSEQVIYAAVSRVVADWGKFPHSSLQKALTFIETPRDQKLQEAGKSSTRTEGYEWLFDRKQDDVTPEDIARIEEKRRQREERWATDD